MYYFLTQNLVDDQDCAEISGHNAITSQYLWTAGHRFDTELPLLELDLDLSEGNTMPDFFDTSVPVMLQKMIDLLKKMGIDNIETYPVLLRDNLDGNEYLNYSAINIIGAIDAADRALSRYEPDSFGEPDFESITIDSEKAGDLKIFRLLTGPDLIVVNQQVADALLSEALTGVMIVPTEDYSEI